MALLEVMELRTSLQAWTITFFSTLGLSPLVACGGTTFTHGDGADAGSSGGSTNGSGGTSSGSGGAIIGAGGGIVFGTGGTVGAGGITGAGGATQRPECKNPKPLLGADGKPTGFVSCDGGGRVRREPMTCTPNLPHDFTCPMKCDPAFGCTPGNSCATDADCTSGTHGWCSAGGQVPNCFCNYGCTDDSECGAGMLCECGDPVGHCVQAACAKKSDCPDGECAQYTPNPGCPGTGYACQTPTDECLADADCGSPAMHCSVVDGVHLCRPTACAVGRPFLVGGAARTANAVRREDWTSALCPDVTSLDRATRAALAARWTEIGLMEHASIAAFARFALEALSLGAPPSLLVRTQDAMADETVHARDAFALASAYGGKPVGPGVLPVEGSLAARSPMDIVETAILEGCIGETVAAVEAAEALAHAKDPAVREALARVTVDETRHAELAWRFVEWVLGGADRALAEATRTRLVAIVEGEAGAIGQRTSHDNSALLRAHGVIEERTRSEIRRRVLADVIVPCARALAAAHAERRTSAVAA